MIEYLKRTAGHRGCLHTSLLKSPELLGVTGSFAGYVQADWKAETLAGAHVRPPATTDDQYHLMVADWEIGNVHSLHEAFGFEMHITR